VNAILKEFASPVLQDLCFWSITALLAIQLLLTVLHVTSNNSAFPAQMDSIFQTLYAYLARVYAQHALTKFFAKLVSQVTMLTVSSHVYHVLHLAFSVSIPTIVSPAQPVFI